MTPGETLHSKWVSQKVYSVLYFTSFRKGLILSIEVVDIDTLSDPDQSNFDDENCATNENKEKKKGKKGEGRKRGNFRRTDTRNRLLKVNLNQPRVTEKFSSVEVNGECRPNTSS